MNNSVRYDPFNVNYYVKVKLNKSGIDELKRQREELNKLLPKSCLPEYEPKIDELGYTKFQMHELMERLGHLCILGSEPPFDTNIMIENRLIEGKE